ncbi:MAG: hypothetical protein QOF82_1018 [Frankiales bacterium]|nr:hypothetical protein [Frankiales bacterium]
MTDDGGTTLARTRLRLVLEVAGLLLAPVVVFFLLGEQGMTNTNIEDQRFYQAYAEHGDDLMLRLGNYRYYWVRLAFILPSRVTYDLFGAVGGFFVLRYLLVLVAIVPAYLLLRRLHGIGAGWVAVAAVLSSPVLLYAWGTDYPDSSSVSYLIAGTACLFMPVRGEHQGRGRVGWLLLAGTAGGLAIHSQFLSAPLVGVAWAVFVVMQLGTDWRGALRASLILAGCAIAVTGMFSLIAWVMWGRADILSPTITAAQHFRTPNELRKWHSPNWHWVLRNTYLVIPLLTPALWAVTARARLAAYKVELGLALTGLLQMLLFTYLQFFAITCELEYHVYSSMLWSSAVLVMAVAVVRLCQPLLGSARTAWLPAALVLVIPYLMTFVRDDMHFQLLAGFAVAAVLLAVVWAGTRWLSGPVAAAGLAALAIGASYAITTAEPPGQTWLQQQRHFPQPDYAHALRNGGAWHAQEDSYRLVAQLNLSMPQATKPGQTLLTWFGPDDGLSSDLTTQYLWTPQSLVTDLPALSDLDQRILVSRHAKTLVLFGPDPDRLSAAVTALQSAGFLPTVTLREVLRSGNLSDNVWVVQLGGRV